VRRNRLSRATKKHWYGWSRFVTWEQCSPPQVTVLPKYYPEWEWRDRRCMASFGSLWKDRSLSTGIKVRLMKALVLVSDDLWMRVVDVESWWREEDNRIRNTTAGEITEPTCQFSRNWTHPHNRWKTYSGESCNISDMWWQQIVSLPSSSTDGI